MTATVAEQLSRIINPVYGDCCYCGRTYQLQPDGTVGEHNEWRVRARYLQSGTVRGEAYRSGDDCDGGGMPPGPKVELYDPSGVAA